ncbi:MAG: tyrosine-type recombinase/integrase, partial [Flavobacteriaceae bacterium]|nr:tyrosine-type recombinase/integrase [Flavobacteriaceae bacterium]
NFSIEEINHVLDGYTHLDTFEGIRNKLIISLFYTTGIRRSELINIKTHDLDIASRKLVVTGKGNKQRIIPLIDNLTEDLEKYLLVRAELPQIQDDYFFITKKGLKMYDVLVYRIINTYFSMVTSKDKKSPHVLRHSFATHLLDEGANLNAIKDLLGHSSLAATQVYTHSSMSALKNVHKHAHPRGEKK